LDADQAKLHVPLIEPFQVDKTFAGETFGTNKTFQITATQGGLLLFVQ
jgi:hypothetical protein